jgi:hypothetical protein
MDELDHYLLCKRGVNGTPLAYLVRDDPEPDGVVPKVDYQPCYFLVLVLHTGCYRVDRSKECTEYMCVTARECSCSRHV